MISAKLDWLLLPILCALLLCGTVTASPTIVYDNTATRTYGTLVPALRDGYWPFNQIWPEEPMGDQITLGGTERTHAVFDLMFSSSQPTTLTSVTLCLHYVNVEDETPGAQFWSGSIQNVAVNGPVPVAVTFAITPDIVLPDTFIWLASADSDMAGLATFDHPTVGSSGNFYWDHDPYEDVWYGSMFNSNPVANFGATVWAEPVPEPATMMMVLLGGLAVRGKRRRG